MQFRLPPPDADESQWTKFKNRFGDLAAIGLIILSIAFFAAVLIATLRR